MPKFIKLRIEGYPDQWRLIISNADDLMKWSRLDNEITFGEWLNQNKNVHFGGRAGNLQTIIEIKSNSLLEGERKSPLEIAAEFLDRKALSMLNMLHQGWELCVNTSGGYCDVSGFIKQWDAKVLSTIEKSDFGFPIDDEVINSEFLVLENDAKNIAYSIKNYLEEVKTKKYSTILSLKSTDQEYVFKAIQNAKTILMHSEFSDDNQVSSFCKSFMKLDRKSIIISTYSKQSKQNLIDNSSGLYNELITKHDVQFI